MTTGFLVLLLVLNVLALFSFSICLHRLLRKKKAKKNEEYYKHLKEASTNHQ